jgi:hypothetical protein
MSRRYQSAQLLVLVLLMLAPAQPAQLPSLSESVLLLLLTARKSNSGLRVPGHITASQPQQQQG